MRKLLSLMSLALILPTHPAAAAEDAARQAEISRRGAEVMPFSLEKTLHQFTKTETGGIQRLIVREAENREQIQLIRQHLEQLSKQFSLGDYSGPESIHGADMAGLAQLKAASPASPGSIRIVYAAEPAGASLTFLSNDKQLIDAVHSWFDAQVHDHGHDAMMRCHHQP